MLEGLEATEVRLSKLEYFRIDAELYDRTYLSYRRKIEALQYTTLQKECKVVRKGIFNVNAGNFSDSGVPFVRISNLKGMKINTTDIVCIPRAIHDDNHKTALVRNDIILSKTAIPAASIVSIDECNTSQDTVAVKLALNSKLNSPYLVTFLNTKYGMEQMKKRFSGNVQMHLNLDECRNELLIPVLSAEIQMQVKELFELSMQKSTEGISLYSSAESYLLACLGMQDFVANIDAYNVKTLKESFLESGRIDAEYYLPKYEDYINAVSAYTGGVAPLGEVCTIKDSNYTPECDMKYRYIELANIGKSGDITGCLYENGEDLPTRARRIVTQGDVIVSSIEGSLSSCALITDDYDQSLCSTGFYVVRSNQINPETLLTLFKSLPIQQLLKKACSGTILTGIGKQEFEKIPIPLIRPEVQEEIAQHVQRSFALRKEASELLEKAKLSVEYAIETGGGNSLIYSRLLNTLAKYERLAMWLLLKELGIVDESPNRQRVVTTEKRLSESFFTSGRLDAEYYQPKYDYLDAQFSSIPTKRLGDIVNIHKSIEPGSDAYQENGIPFVRVADLSKFGIETSSICLDSSTYSTAPRPRKNTILLSKDGSVGIAYKMEEDADIITSGAILHLSMKGKELLPDYLTLVLNSPIVRMQAERDAGGSIIQHWKPSEISQVIIPMLPVYIQQKLSDLVSKSFAFRRESKALLERAKAMVEQAIEFSA